MPLEVATYINGLDSANPTPTDPKSQGDDHLRLVKSTIKNTFPNVNSAINASDEEVNFLAGVTSLIQVQLNDKLSKSGPAFSAYRSGAQSIAVSTHVKVQFNVETIDTNTCFDPATNFRFTPTLAGYYLLCLSTGVDMGLDQGYINASITWNGVINGAAWGSTNNATTSVAAASVSKLIYFNGTTDYAEATIYQFNTGGGAKNLISGAINSFFTGHFVRAV